MPSRNRTTLARVVLLALLFRVGLGFGHGPVVAAPEDPLLRGYCGTTPAQPAVPYQGCPICHALAYAADLDHGISAPASLPVLVAATVALPAGDPLAPGQALRTLIKLPRSPPRLNPA